MPAPDSAATWNGQPLRAASTTYTKLVEFEDQFRDPEEKPPLLARLRREVTRMVTECNTRKDLVRLVPLIGTIRKYKVKDDLPGDFFAGLTSGVMLIPLGVAFATVATLPPIVGLYLTFFASVAYAFLGTGRQASWGCIAVVSLMMGTLLDKYDESAGLTCANGTVVDTLSDLELCANGGNSSMSPEEISNDPEHPVTSRRMEVASGVSLVAGLVTIAASRLGLSRVSSLMSDSLNNAFTVGIVFHIVTSQLVEIFGVSVPRQSGVLSIVWTWAELFKRMRDTNLATVITSVICMLVLYLVKRCVNARFRKSLRIPIPIDLIVAVVATLIVKFGRIHENYDVRVVGDVPAGMPSPKIPNLSLCKSYILDGLIIALVAYTQTLAVVKTFGLEHGYAIDPAQEMLAAGVANALCGIFSGYIASAAVAPSVLQNAAGGRTQVASLVAAVLVLVAILFAGPHFYYLPKCVLSAIILVSLRSMFLKLLTIPDMWRRSGVDCAVWVITCLATVFLNPALGLLVSVLFSVFAVGCRTIRKPVVEVGQIENGPAAVVELRSTENYSAAETSSSVRIIKIQSPVLFVNSEAFVDGVFAISGVNPFRIKKDLLHRGDMERDIRRPEESPGELLENGGNGEIHRNGNGYHHIAVEGERACRTIVLDAAHMSFVDLMGIQALQLVITEMQSVGVEVYISAVPERVMKSMKLSGFWEEHGDRLFLSVDAALASPDPAADTMTTRF